MIDRTQHLTCPRRMGAEIIKAAGLPEGMGDLWVVEAIIDGNGITTYNVEQLGVVLAANDMQIGRGQQIGYVPFAFCRSLSHAKETIDRMRRKQAALTALSETEQAGPSVSAEEQRHEAA